ncbi:hypothetical protein BLNAU_13383 [Blattamonas nauphoetae]|uniref:Uncharacterized protein n=1 Tax=Blattamonas nauphoetae TaxID=2049346 RepID=A0ABQ9XJI6_9EUKA|nr:hypothetical protein BLNAU_13383 [Blattamonas nauphoetae]
MLNDDGRGEDREHVAAASTNRDDAERPKHLHNNLYVLLLQPVRHCILNRLAPTRIRCPTCWSVASKHHKISTHVWIEVTKSEVVTWKRLINSLSHQISPNTTVILKTTQTASEHIVSRSSQRQQQGLVNRLHHHYTDTPKVATTFSRRDEKNKEGENKERVRQTFRVIFLWS